MGKYDSSFERVALDFYPSPDWVTETLADYVELAGRQVWECACGDGRMAEALKHAGAKVYASDIADYGYAGMHELLDFTSTQNPKLRPLDPRIITNAPHDYPGGRGGKLAVAFAESGLRRIGSRGLLALLLRADFDSAPTRRHLFADCPDFTAKIVLTRRVVWYEHPDPKRERPMEHHAWFVWQRPRRIEGPPVLLYDTPQPKIQHEHERGTMTQ